MRRPRGSSDRVACRAGLFHNPEARIGFESRVGSRTRGLSAPRQLPRGSRVSTTSLSMVLHVIEGDRGDPPLVYIVGVDDKVHGFEVPPELNPVVFLVYLVALPLANCYYFPALPLVHVVPLRCPARLALASPAGT